MKKRDILFLSGIINENEYHEGHHSGIQNYMFFSNLKVIRDRVQALLSMDPHMLDAMLQDGHDWANDHIATSKDDVEEVFNWATSRTQDEC